MENEIKNIFVYYFYSSFFLLSEQRSQFTTDDNTSTISLRHFMTSKRILVVISGEKETGIIAPRSGTFFTIIFSNGVYVVLFFSDTILLLSPLENRIPGMAVFLESIYIASFNTQALLICACLTSVFMRCK